MLLCGGADIDPARYGQTDVHPEVYDVDALQDEADLSLAAYCFEHGVPTLAVCRGLHVVNVLRGGSLVQHMDEHHRHVVHDVVIERGPAGLQLRQRPEGLRVGSCDVSPAATSCGFIFAPLFPRPFLYIVLV